MWRYDAGRTAASPHQLPDELSLLWVREYPKLEQTWDDPLNQDLMPFGSVYEPVVHRGILFITSSASDCMIALEAETGRELWRYYVDGPVRFPGVASKGRVYFTSDDGHLYCLEAESGGLMWKVNGAPVDRQILGNERLISTWPARGGPVLEDGVVYFAAGIWPFMGIFIFAVDAETGEVIWKNDGTGARYMLQPHNSPAYAGVAPQGHLVIAGDRLLVPGGRSVPACFDLKTGEFLYYRLAENGKTGGAFVAAQGDFFVNYHRDSVVSLYELSGGEAVLPRLARVPVMTPERLFSRGDLVTALDLENIRQTDVEQKVVFDRATGGIETVDEKKWEIDPLWQVKADASGDLILAGERLYAGGDEVISAISLPTWGTEPEVVWEVGIEGKVGRLIAADGKLFAVTEEGRIFAFGRERDEEPTVWRGAETPFEVDEEIVGRARSILASTGIREGYCLVFGAGDGDLAEALLEESDLRVIAIESDRGNVEQLRRRFDAAGLHGKRFSVKFDGDGEFRLPSYLASLVVVEDLQASQWPEAEAFFSNIFEGLRPYGGTAYIAADERVASQVAGRLSEMGLANAVVRRITHDRALQEGVEGAGRQFESGGVNDDLVEEIERASGLLTTQGHVLLVREGALPGSGDWTHQYGDAANTVKSDDQLVKLPLGVLWFGGSSNTDVLPRHGHGPPEQVIGGRLFIEGINSLSARDVYTGRVLWKRQFSRLNTAGIYYDETYRDTPLDTAYNQVHIPGANARGTNFVATEDRIYLVLEDSCVVLDPVTGKTLDEFELPPEASGKEAPEWAYIAVYGDYLVGGAGFADYLDHLDLDELDPRMGTRLNSFYNFDITASKRLVVMNRYSGEVLWTREAKLGYWHNAIAVADDTLFYIDRLAPSVSAALKQRPGRFRFPPAELTARRLRDGALRWNSTKNVFGTWLSYSEEHRLLVQAGRSSSDMLRGEPEGVSVHRADDGSILWESDISDRGPYILHGETIITEGTAYSLLTGEQKMRTDPLTGEVTPWIFRRDYGCNYIIGSENLLTFRSAAAGFLDLQSDSGTGTFGGFRSSCTSNLIAANGVLNAPDYTRTCSCSYQNQTSLALIHMPELDLWTTYYSQPKAASIGEARTAVLLSDPRANLVFGNKAFRALFELAEEEELGELSILDLTESPEEMEAVLEGLQQERSWSGNLDIRKADGTVEPIHLMARVLSDEAFVPAAWIFLFEESPEGAVAFLDLSGTVTYVDDTFLQLWSAVDAQEVLGASFQDLWEEEAKAGVVLKELLKGQEWHGQLTVVRDAADRRDIELSASAVRDEAGEVVASVITCFDVTERKKLEAEASRLVKDLGNGRSLHYFLNRRQPVQRLGVNFGAPGDRQADSGTLWLEWPSNPGPSPPIELSIKPETATVYTHHPSWVEGDGHRWIAASGVSGLSSLSLDLGGGTEGAKPEKQRLFDVYLYFAEPEDLASGERLFEIRIQGEPALEQLDVVREAGGARRLVVKLFKGITVEERLEIEFVPLEGSRVKDPILCGLEVIAQPPS
ncbi:MAG: PQQ-binding-like beta-propeller repeat protein [Acidobacteriota bacterium]|nr:MAG: PQQ-binding-like beta-propeller repeat protein [Acidobacteriota bacterium]